MDPLGTKAIAETVDKAVPQIADMLTGAEGTVERTAAGLEATVKDSLTTALAGIADGVSQVVGIGLRLDGATVQLDGIEISIKNPRLTLTLGPYKS